MERKMTGKFAYFTEISSEQPIAINLDHVLFVNEPVQGQVWIHFSQDHRIVVKGNLAEVVERIEQSIK